MCTRDTGPNTYSQNQDASSSLPDLLGCRTHPRLQIKPPGGSRTPDQTLIQRPRFHVPSVPDPYPCHKTKDASKASNERLQGPRTYLHVPAHIQVTAYNSTYIQFPVKCSPETAYRNYNFKAISSAIV